MLHNHSTFKADIAAAATEIGALRRSGEVPNADCNAETAALAIPVDGRAVSPALLPFRIDQGWPSHAEVDICKGW